MGRGVPRSADVAVDVSVEHAIGSLRAPSIVGCAVRSEWEAPLFVRYHRGSPLLNDVHVVRRGGALQGAAIISVAAALERWIAARDRLDWLGVLVDPLSANRFVGISRWPSHPVIGAGGTVEQEKSPGESDSA